MMIRTLAVAAVAITLAACGDRAEEPEAAPDTAAASAVPGHDPDTTMAPPPAMDSSMRGAVPATDTTTPDDSAAAHP